MPKTGEQFRCPECGMVERFSPTELMTIGDPFCPDCQPKEVTMVPWSPTRKRKAVKKVEKALEYTHTTQNIAKIVLTASEKYEGEWDEEKGRHKWGMDICVMYACGVHNADPVLSQLIYLALQGSWNDAIAWAAKEVGNA